MFKYIFILGRNSRLSIAEIKAVLPKAKIIQKTNSFLILETGELDSQKLLRQLGGTVKIGQIISQKISAEIIANELLKEKPKGKINFGISYYGSKQLTNNSKQYERFGLEIKNRLKKLEVSSRLVVSREPVLSSVVVKKNKCYEFLILAILPHSAPPSLEEGGEIKTSTSSFLLPGEGGGIKGGGGSKKWLGKTLAVQEFEDYSFRDFGRPVRDTISGMMPPKLAKIMINLAQLPASSGAAIGGQAQLPKSATILDPFCGSGTILQEAILLGYKDVIGADASDKALNNTKRNLEWLKNNFQLPIFNFQLFNLEVKKISQKITGSSIDAIITEPYLGPALSGRETKRQLKKIISDLERLYLVAFEEFKKVLKPGGKVVIVFPAFRAGKDILELPILEQIKKLGFSQLNKDKLIYSRPNQKIWRQIFVFKIN